MFYYFTVIHLQFIATVFGDFHLKKLPTLISSLAGDEPSNLFLMDCWYSYVLEVGMCFNNLVDNCIPSIVVKD